MSFQDGAAFFMNYVTAYILLFDIGNLRTGQSVLLHCAGGGVVRVSYHISCIASCENEQMLPICGPVVLRHNLMVQIVTNV